MSNVACEIHQIVLKTLEAEEFHAVTEVVQSKKRKNLTSFNVIAYITTSVNCIYLFLSLITWFESCQCSCSAVDRILSLKI